MSVQSDQLLPELKLNSPGSLLAHRVVPRGASWVLSAIACCWAATLIAANVAAVSPTESSEAAALSISGSNSSAEEAPTSATPNQAVSEAANMLNPALPQMTWDWLGPLAPIALSPYFGITCLAVMSQWGDSWGFAPNSLVGQNPVLREPLVLWVFLGLTLLTSLPRLTKLSKPIVQMLDRVETYSVVITLLVIRWAQATSGEVAVAPEVSAGIGSFSWELLLMIAAAINVIVISTVRFVCEVMVWFMPFPAVDALFEGVNKATCAALMALYAFSPLLATLFNLSLFAICLAIAAPMWRRAVYLRAMLGDPILSSIFPAMSQLDQGSLTVFNLASLGPFPAKSRLRLERGAKGWQLKRVSWWGVRCLELAPDVGPLRIKKGILVNRIVLEGLNNEALIFSRRYSQTIDSVARELNLASPRGESNKAVPEGL